MTEPVVINRSFAIACVALLQAFVPGIVSVCSLYLLTRLFDVDFDNIFVVMSAIVAVLSVVLITPPRNGSALVTGTMPLAVSVIGRWIGLITVLLVIAFATKFSAE